jgi:hypothetical protein
LAADRDLGNRLQLAIKRHHIYLMRDRVDMALHQFDRLGRRNAYA